jgi:hypothetical protein
MVQQLVLDRPSGDNAMSDKALIIMGSVFIALFGVLFPVFLFSIRFYDYGSPAGWAVRSVLPLSPNVSSHAMGADC